MKKFPWFANLAQSDKGSAVQQIHLQLAVVSDKCILMRLCHPPHLRVAGMIQHQIDLLRVAALGIKLCRVRKSLPHFQIQHDQIAFAKHIEHLLWIKISSRAHQRQRIDTERLRLEQNLQVVIVLRQTEQRELGRVHAQRGNQFADTIHFSGKYFFKSSRIRKLSAVSIAEFRQNMHRLLHIPGIHHPFQILRCEQRLFVCPNQTARKRVVFRFLLTHIRTPSYSVGNSSFAVSAVSSDFASETSASIVLLTVTFPVFSR